MRFSFVDNKPVVLYLVTARGSTCGSFHWKLIKAVNENQWEIEI